MATIGIVGMGRMGQTIASLLEGRESLKSIPFQRISADNQALLRQCDVIIEFTIAEAAPGVIRHCLEHNIPVVSGTTGWHEYHLESIIAYCKQKRGKFLYATNFSIGMNIVFELNRKLAEVMNTQPQFKPSVKEIHHVHKKDSPSGTAYTLIEDILKQHRKYEGFTLNPENLEETGNKLPVISIRAGEVKGYHQVSWESPGEKVLIAHEALDREIFAEGAILAAQWLSGQSPGIYSMKDIIRL